MSANLPDYFVAFDQVPPSRTLRQLATQLLQWPRKVVGSIQLAELCSMPKHPNGLYFLFHPNGELWYVGRSAGRSFIERIPSHFDQRADAWFNTMPKRIFTRGKVPTYEAALTLAPCTGF